MFWNILKYDINLMKWIIFILKINRLLNIQEGY